MLLYQFRFLRLVFANIFAYQSVRDFPGDLNEVVAVLSRCLTADQLEERKNIVQCRSSVAPSPRPCSEFWTPPSALREIFLVGGIST